MKIFLTILFAFIFCLSGNSQIYEPVTYQSIIHNQQGQVVAKQKISLKLSILRGSPLDTIVYSEVQNPLTSELGLISVIVGNGKSSTGDFASIDWNKDKFFMKVEIDPAGGTNFIDMGTIQLLSIPYATTSNNSKKSKESLSEDKLLISRKYIGKFIDFRQTGPNESNGPNIIWVKTSMESSFGKFSAFGKKCEFSPGDNLYIKRMYYSPGGVFGYWEYRIENDSSVYYRLSDYQYDRKVLVESWFK